MARTPEQEADLELLRPLAQQIKAAMCGVARQKRTEKQLMDAPDEMFFIMADHVRNYLKEHSVGLVKIQ